MNLPLHYDLLNPKQRKLVREEYIRRQNNRCMFCNEKLNESPPQNILNLKLDLSLFPPNFLKHPVHLQHNHTTGLTEGAVHAYCNGVMWQYENR